MRTKENSLTRLQETLIVFGFLVICFSVAWVGTRYMALSLSADLTRGGLAMAPPPVERAAAAPAPLPSTSAAPPVAAAGSPAPAPSVASTDSGGAASLAAAPHAASLVAQLRARGANDAAVRQSSVSALEQFLWGVYPYLCIALFFTVPVIRMASRPFAWSTRASSLFASRSLGAASLLMHWGLFLVLAGHLVGLFGGLLGSKAPIDFFYWSALVGGLMVLAGSILALGRRVVVREVRAMSQIDDYLVHLFLVPIVSLALYQVVVDRIFGVAYTASSWAASLWTLSPQPELMSSASLLTKLHVLLALSFFAYFPFTKLVHFWTFPINYFVRSPQSMRTQRFVFQRRWELLGRSDKSWLVYGLAAVAVLFALSGNLIGRAATPATVRAGMTASGARDSQISSKLTGYPLYVSQCARCHGLGGRGDGPGANSPTFTNTPRDVVMARYHFVSTANGIASDDDLYRSIAQGLGNSGMPAFASLSEEQIVSLVDVLNGFRAASPPPGPAIHVGPPPPPTPDTIARGEQLFQQQCAECHGPDGSGNGTKKCYDWRQREIPPRNLRQGQLKVSTQAEDLFTRITVGVPGGFGDTNLMMSFANLPEADRWAIVHFVRAKILPAWAVEDGGE